MNETVEQSAATIWGMARDLASPRVSGTPLNAERNIRHIVTMLNALAVAHSQTSIVADEVLKRAALSEQIKHRDATIKELRAELKKRDGGVTA